MILGLAAGGMAADGEGAASDGYSALGREEIVGGSVVGLLFERHGQDATIE